MRILALDQSSRVSGYAIFEDNNLIDFGTFSVTMQDLSKRLVKIREKVLDLVNEYKIDKIYFEDIQLQKTVINNVSTFKALSEVFGVISETCSEFKIPAEPVHSTSWKAKIKIPTNARRPVQKKMAQEYALEVYKVKASEDASDAICIGTYALSLNGFDIKTIQYKTDTKIESGFDWSD